MKAAPDSYLVQIHDQQKLDQEQGYGEEPVHVAIGVVEGLARDDRAANDAIGRGKLLGVGVIQ